MAHLSSGHGESDMSIMSVRFPSLNPATQLGLWMVTGIFALNLEPSISVGVALIVAALAGVYAPLNFVRLLKRSRWLLVSVALVFLLMAPGSGISTVYGLSVPSVEGLRLALDQIGRLVLAMAMLALLLKRMSISELVAGARHFFVLLNLRGFNPDRAALRLVLTLQLLEQDSQRSDSLKWRNLMEMDLSAEEMSADISMSVYPFGWADRLVLLFAFVGSLMFLGMTLIHPIDLFGS